MGYGAIVRHKLYITLAGQLMKLIPPARYHLFSGEGSSAQLGIHMVRSACGTVLVVTDQPLVESGVVTLALRGLRESGVNCVVFDGVRPDPDFAIIEAGFSVFRGQGCDSVLAVGGGSSIDVAKMIAMAANNPGPLRRYIGFGKLKASPVPLFAIPTTAGTGSEATTGAIISDTENHEKHIVADHRLLPLAAALDPLLMRGLPPAITAATGMDALTHAIEAYIGHWNAADSKDRALTAVKLVFQNLPRAVADGDDLQARDAMAHAAYLAGQAINLVNVGNAHAIAHQLGAFYGVPHGLANAIVLPAVLELSLQQAQRPLDVLAHAIGRRDGADFIAAVVELNAAIGVPLYIEGLREADIGELARRAVKEGAGYPVPHLLRIDECERLLHRLLAK